MSMTDSTESAGHGGFVRQQLYRQAAILWIARFGASSLDLITRFGLSEDPQLANDTLKWAFENRYVELFSSSSDQPEFYLPTSRGMAYAARTRGGAYLGRWIECVNLLKERGEEFNRAVASVAVAQALLVQGNEQYSNRMELLDEWQVRAMGRTNRFAIQAQVDGRQQLRLPPIVLKERDDKNEDEDVEDGHAKDAEALGGIEQTAVRVLPVLIEVITADKGDAEVRSILVNRNNRNDISCVLCYVAPERRDVVLKVIRSIKAQEKIRFYQMPPQAEARGLLAVKPEELRDKTLLTLNVEEKTRLGRILECVYDFETVSLSGLTDYLEIEPWDVTVLIECAMKGGLLKKAEALCDGVDVYSVTDDGADYLKLEKSDVTVTITGARRAKDRLRIAAKLQRQKRHYGCTVMSPLKMRRETGMVPSVVVKIHGRPHRSHADLTIVRPGAADDPLTVAVMSSDQDSLEAASLTLQAWAEIRVKRVVFYAVQELLHGLKAFAKEIGVADRVAIKALPELEQVIQANQDKAEKEKALEEADARAALKQQETEVSDAEQEDKAMARMLGKVEAFSQKEVKPSRLDVTDPEVRAFRPINDAAALEYADVLRQCEVEIEKWQVSWRLLVNVALLHIERKIPIDRINVDTAKVGRDTFEKKVYEMHAKGAWKLLPEIIEYSEADLPVLSKRPKLDWSLVDPEEFLPRNKFVRPNRPPSYLERLRRGEPIEADGMDLDLLKQMEVPDPEEW